MGVSLNHIGLRGETAGQRGDSPTFMQHRAIGHLLAADALAARVS